ncbi:phosphoribosylanthranilate isomerase [Mesonia phycicola]|uniref:N-(5'-phosphoribosyl)anthranilate isomerase n=1 Tax=Mesonia phycicola TaxID=579105 RepID=A0A1M6ADT2_9FLAO|nr:phosphoribosylanthranilate isomerase [Mesonia phycicola]SHI34557.1 phosphoribosylanthranilate isomerase [Mesonia phycicola]
MKYEENIMELAQLQPDYMGIIFYEKSPRYVDTNIPSITSTIKKTGVFVNAEISFIQQKIEDYSLQAIQLHGNESVEYCKELKKKLKRPFDSAQGENKQDEIPNQVRDDGFERHAELDSASHYTGQHKKSVEIIKAFSIKDQFDFQELEKYLLVVDYFLFDTKGKKPGGNGYTFNWQVLENYPFQKPFFLSGGIGLDEVEKIKEFQNKNLPLYAIDLNSKFETEPGKKNIEKLKNFKKKINS